MKKLIYLLYTCFSLLIIQGVKGQTAATDNKVSETLTYREMPKGLSVYGIFEGRTPCSEISRQLEANLPRDCDHLKWQIIFFRDSLTMKPTKYTLVTEMFERRPLQGKWKITHGSKTDPTAIVYELSYGNSGKSIYLLKGNENVLFILDENREFRIGNRDYSYTLNRVQKIRH